MPVITPEMVSAALAVADEFERDLNLGDRGARSVVRQMLLAALAVASPTTHTVQPPPPPPPPVRHDPTYRLST